MLLFKQTKCNDIPDFFPVRFFVAVLVAVDSFFAADLLDDVDSFFAAGFFFAVATVSVIAFSNAGTFFTVAFLAVAEDCGPLFVLLRFGGGLDSSRSETAGSCTGQAAGFVFAIVK